MWWSSARNHRPYLFDGTLREQIAYPARDSANELDGCDANATGSLSAEFFALKMKKMDFVHCASKIW